VSGIDAAIHQKNQPRRSTAVVGCHHQLSVSVVPYRCTAVSTVIAESPPNAVTLSLTTDN
jgi:hypothetical protein